MFINWFFANTLPAKQNKKEKREMKRFSVVFMSGLGKGVTASSIGDGSLLLMSRPTNREVVPAGTRDESGQYMLTGGGSLQAAREIQDDVGSQTDAFNDLPHQEEPPVEWVINVREMIENSEEAPASMLNHGQMNAIVKKLTEVVKDLSSDKEELRKILPPLCCAMIIALPTLKFNGYLNDHSIIPPLEFVGIVNAVAFAGFMAGFSLDKIAPKIANFCTQSGIALTIVSVFSLSSWIFSVKASVVPAFFGVLALGTWGISCFIRGLGGAAA